MLNSPLLQTFVCDERYQLCEGHIFVPFWGSVLPVAMTMDVNAKQPHVRSIEILEAIVSYKGNFRDHFIQAVFEYYTNEIYGTFDQYDQDWNDITHLVAPQINEPNEIWPLLSEPKMNIKIIASYESKYKVHFGMSFECLWDQEHGCGVLCQDWDIWVGQAGDVW
jgi:hypothetical protein